MVLNAGCAPQRRSSFTIDDLITRAKEADAVSISYWGYGESPTRLELRESDSVVAILKTIRLRTPFVVRDPAAVSSSENRVGLIFNSATDGYLFDVTFISHSSIVVRYGGKEHAAELADDEAVKLLLRVRTEAAQ